MMSLLSANGPMRAIPSFFCRGSIPSFLSRTLESAAASRASARNFGTAVIFLLRLHVRRAVRIFKQSQTVFQRQNAIDAFVDLFHRDFTRFHERFARLQIAGGDHFHIAFGVDGQFCRFPQVLGVTVIDHLRHGIVIADHDSVESPFLAQFAAQHLIARARRAVEGIERGHHHCHARVHASLISGEIIGVHGIIRHIDAVVIPARLGRAVAGEMLRAAAHDEPGIDVFLIALDESGSHLSEEHRVFAESFHHPAPTRVAL